MTVNADSNRDLVNVKSPGQSKEGYTYSIVGDPGPERLELEPAVSDPLFYRGARENREAGRSEIFKYSTFNGEDEIQRNPMRSSTEWLCRHRCCARNRLDDHAPFGSPVTAFRSLVIRSGGSAFSFPSAMASYMLETVSRPTNNHSCMEASCTHNKLAGYNMRLCGQCKSTYYCVRPISLPALR
jgi:hypothetical protein